MLVNAPPVAAYRAAAVRGAGDTYYCRGRTVSRRRGARGGRMLIGPRAIAPLPVRTVVGRCPGASDLPRAAGGGSARRAGWITDMPPPDAHACRLAWRNCVGRRRRRVPPGATGITVDCVSTNRVRGWERDRLPWSSRPRPRLQASTRALPAHWDHLGSAPSSRELIYNGALENASGWADMLAIARAAAAGRGRSVVALQPSLRPKRAGSRSATSPSTPGAG